MLSDHDISAATPSDMDMETQDANKADEDEEETGDLDDNEIDMANDRESSDDESDVEDDEDQELRSNSATKPRVRTLVCLLTFSIAYLSPQWSCMFSNAGAPWTYGYQIRIRHTPQIESKRC